MEHTAQIELANQADRVAVELGVLNPEMETKVAHKHT